MRKNRKNRGKTRIIDVQPTNIGENKTDEDSEQKKVENEKKEREIRYRRYSQIKNTIQMVINGLEDMFSVLVRKAVGTEELEIELENGDTELVLVDHSKKLQLKDAVKCKHIAEIGDMIIKNIRMLHQMGLLDDEDLGIETDNANLDYQSIEEIEYELYDSIPEGASSSDILVHFANRTEGRREAMNEYLDQSIYLTIKALSEGKNFERNNSLLYSLFSAKNQYKKNIPEIMKMANYAQITESMKELT